MSRRRIAALLAPLAIGGGFQAAPGHAQDGQTASPPERIDLTVTAPPRTASDEDCRRRREAAVVSGEIVVCGSRPGGEDPRYSSREDARNRYAAKTAFRDAPATPDVAGAGIFRGPPTFSGLCVKGVFNCPRPPALIVDVRALPQAPPGSDAERVGRGLAPLGEDDSTVVARQVTARQRTDLGLPEPAPEPAPGPDGGPAAKANPEESAAPAAPR